MQSSGSLVWLKGVFLPSVDRPLSILRLVVFYGGLVAIWQILYEAQVWSPFLFPEPAQVLRSLQRYLENGVLAQAFFDTMRRMLVGFAIAFVGGIVIGFGIGTVRWLDQTLGTLVVGMQSLPSVTWLPLAILWYGLGENAIIFVVVLGSVWAIAISARDGIRNIPVLQQRAAQVFGANHYQKIRYVTIPGMLPSMAQGLKLGWSFSWRSLMAAEIVFATTGLGRLLELGRDLNNMSLVIGIMIVIVAVGLAFDRLIFNPLEKWVQNRWGLAHS
jgi:NitT/TauT family transport system permease protein